MDAILFLIAFIWIIVSVSSIFISPFVGFDREKILAQLLAHWISPGRGGLYGWMERVVLVFCFVGFIFPAVRPLFAIAVSIIIFLFI